jgi:hypothetical protein
MKPVEVDRLVVLDAPILDALKCDREGVEIGGQPAISVVDVGISNADLRHPPYGPCFLPGQQPGRESLI